MRYSFDEGDQAYIAEQGFIKSTQFEEQIFVFVFKLLLSGEGFAEHARSFPVKPFSSLAAARTVTPGSDRVQPLVFSTFSIAPNVFRCSVNLHVQRCCSSASLLQMPHQPASASYL